MFHSDTEYKFVSLVWNNEPINSTDLMRLWADKLGWGKTTYIVLMKLCEHGILQNRDATIAALAKYEDGVY